MTPDLETWLLDQLAAYRDRRDSVANLQRKLADLRDVNPFAANQEAYRCEDLGRKHDRMSAEMLDEMVRRML